MPALAFTLALALQAGAASAPPNPVARPAAAAGTEPGALSPQAELAELEHVYQESCETRAYGRFDDLCTSLADQIAAYRRQMKRDAAQAARSARKPSAPPR